MSNFNLPFEIEESNVLLAAMGGGQDALAALPLMSKLEHNNDIFISSFNIDSNNYFESELLTHLHWPLEIFKRGGVAPLLKQLEEYVQDNAIDVIVGVDGGVDSLMHGDELNGGTLLDDLISLAALSNLKINRKYLACLGFSTETEENLDHHAVLENMAELFRKGAFLGASALTCNMEEFEDYKKVCEAVWEKLDRKSHIQTKVISSVLGGFGPNQYEGADPNVNGAVTKAFVNPLMSLYWFFDMELVYNSSELCKKLYSLKTNTNTDNLMVYRSIKKTRVKSRFLEDVL